MDSKTNNPQAAAPTSLQQTGGDSLQVTASQTQPSVDQLDGGSQAIPLSQATSSSESTAQPAPVPDSNHAAAYSILGVVVLILVIVFSYSLLRER